MYEFSSGPLTWAAFAVFFAGIVFRIIRAVRENKKEGFAGIIPGTRMSLPEFLKNFATLSIKNLKRHPFFTLYSILFYIGLILTPIFAYGHIAVWDEAHSIHWWSFPDYITKICTFLVLITLIIFALQRIADQVLRRLTFWSDYTLLFLTFIPFITGPLAFYHVFDYHITIIVHIWSGALWLMVLPLTRVMHVFFLPFSWKYLRGDVRYAEETVHE